MENISNVFGFIGGLGMFLYGMYIMADGMQKSAGSKMHSFLGMLTNNRFMAVGLGALITAIIQSSGATTVMVVGFVSAGVLNLNQAVGVIMGANIGTTITAWIVSMSQIGDAFEFAKPEFYAPVFIGIGALFIVFSKTNKRKTIGEIFIGLGFLFLGLKYMSGSIKPYTAMPIFSRAFIVLGSNPLLGMIVGCIVTALLQSSSASVGILQTLAMNGVVTTNAAVFITLGQNIGSCVTAILSSVGGSRTAKRAATIHLSFNIIGAIVFGLLGFLVFSFDPILAAHNITPVEISLFHTFFNLTNTAILFPFANQLVKLSGIIIKEQPEEIEEDLETAKMKQYLDERIFETPVFAIETAVKEVVHMGNISLSNVQRAINSIVTGDMDDMNEVLKVEQTINDMEKLLTEYLVKVDNLSITDQQKKVVNNLFYTVSDIERIGDHAENLAESARYISDNKLKFSETALNDLRKISEEVCQAVYYAINAREFENLESVRKVNQYEDIVDNLEDELRDKHIGRLSAGSCIPASGIVFIDIISNLERISDHATNIAGYVKKEI